MKKIYSKNNWYVEIDNKHYIFKNYQDKEQDFIIDKYNVIGLKELENKYELIFNNGEN